MFSVAKNEVLEVKTFVFEAKKLKLAEKAACFLGKCSG